MLTTGKIEQEKDTGCQYPQEGMQEGQGRTQLWPGPGKIVGHVSFGGKVAYKGPRLNRGGKPRVAKGDVQAPSPKSCPPARLLGDTRAVLS